MWAKYLLVIFVLNEVNSRMLPPDSLGKFRQSERFKRFLGSEIPFVLLGETEDFPIARIALNLHIEEIRKILEVELAENPTYYAVWQEATRIFEDDVATGKYDIIAPNEFYQAIISYTYVNDTLYVYKDFNKRSHELTNIVSWNQFPYKSLYSLLAQSVIYVISSPDAIGKQITVYRGLSFHFPCEEGQVINLGQFSSFSVSKDIAEEFAGNGTVLQILPPLQPMTAIGIQEYSVFYDQEEVLVMPWSMFIVKTITQVENKLEIVLESIANRTRIW